MGIKTKTTSTTNITKTVTTNLKVIKFQFKIP